MPDPTPRPPRRPGPLLIGAGVLAAALAFGLPQLLPTAATPAPPAAEPTPAVPPAAPALGPALLRLAAVTAVVCGLCVLATRYLAGRQAPAATGAMEVLASLPVGGRCVVHLVRSGDRRLLVGTDPAGVKCLVELPARPAAEAEPAAPAEPVVLGPARVPDGDEILALLARVRTAPAGPTSPG